MIETKSSPKSGENSWLWLLKIVTGFLVVIVLAIHLVVNHLVAPGGLLTYKEVIVYLSNPGIMAMEICFLVFVISHCLLGLRSILLDLKPSRSALGIINGIFMIVGLVAIVYGIWLVFHITAI